MPAPLLPMTAVPRAQVAAGVHHLGGEYGAADEGVGREKGADRKGKIFVGAQVNAHSLRRNIILADCLKRPAIRGMYQ